MGAILGTRNPSAHERFGPLDAQEALEYLGLASLLMRRLDDADVVNRAAGISDPTPRL
jgi:hypothetical protein